jgi:hypothetical protein
MARKKKTYNKLSYYQRDLEEKAKERRKKKKKIIKKLLIILGSFILMVIVMDFWALRQVSSVQLDDVSPAIECDEKLIEKSDVLMVIPIFEESSIVNNAEWCSYILSLNKTLGMHGVYHTYKEFSGNISEEYVLEGIKAFKECFGFEPQLFEAPQLSLSRENRDILKSIGLEVKGWPYHVFHKVYHCQDTGQFAMNFGKIKITNKLIDFI